MDVLEVTVAERGQIVIPKQARDAMGIKPGTRLEMRLVDGTLVLAKQVRLNLDKWIGSAQDDGLTTQQALQELRGRPVPWTGSVEDKQILASPHAEAVATLAKRQAAPRAARKKTAR